MFNTRAELLQSLVGKTLVNTSMLIAIGFGSENVNIHKVLNVGTELVMVEVIGLDYRDRSLMSHRYFLIENVKSVSLPIQEVNNEQVTSVGT